MLYNEPFLPFPRGYDPKRVKNKIKIINWHAGIFENRDLSFGFKKGKKN